MTQITFSSPSSISRKQTRQFTDDYRLQVIAFIEHDKRVVSTVAKELGISDSHIYGWLKQHKEGGLPKKGADSAPLPVCSFFKQSDGSHLHCNTQMRLA